MMMMLMVLMVVLIIIDAVVVVAIGAIGAVCEGRGSLIFALGTCYICKIIRRQNR